MRLPTTSYSHGYSNNQHGGSTGVQSHFLLPIPGWAVKTCHYTRHTMHYSTTNHPRGRIRQVPYPAIPGTRPCPSIVDPPRPILDLASTHRLSKQECKACVTQDLESFHRLILYVTMVSRDGRPSSTHPRPSLDPRRPCLLLPYKRAGRGLYKGGERRTTKNQSPSHHRRSTSQAISFVLSLFLSKTWDRSPLSQLVTPTQTLRCKEIQYSPLPAGRRVFFCPNQDKPPCTLLASSSRLGTRSIDSLVGLGPSQDQTPTSALHSRIIFPKGLSLLSFQVLLFASICEKYI
jgi:hypothetical protein